LIGLSASADPLSARLRMVARGQLPGAGTLVTVRVAGGAETLRRLGLDARVLSADVAALTVDGDALAYLASMPVRVEPSRRLHPLLDRAALAIGAPAARAATGVTGRGALVGIVDTGADFRHGDLRGLDGHTRIAAMLDQSHPADDRHIDLGSYGGAIFLREEIDAVLDAEIAGTTPALPIEEIDDEGHGTHVASIAAGTGLASGNGLPAGRYLGIAPEAELLIARTTDEAGNISDVGVLSACRFFLDRAAALSRPLVVNFSLGAGAGPHDGTTNFEQAFDQLFPQDTAGRVVVVAAGNDGGRDLHAGGWALDGEITLPLLLPADGAGELSLELWYRGGIELAVETPDGRQSELVGIGGNSDDSFEGQGRVLVDNARQASPSGAIEAGVVLQPIGGRLTAGTWKVHVRGRAIRYDAWLHPSAVPAHFSDRLVTDDRLAIPATAHGAIAVGSTVTRLDWPTADGRDFVPTGADPTRTGGPSFFSSPGPTADGRFAPDVSAPGEYVVAAMSRDATPDKPRSVFRADVDDLAALVADDGVHGALRGTSQATPMVTGTIALLLSAAPQLTSETAREILRVTAAPVEGTAGWSPRVGFGRIDVAAALAFLNGARGTIADPQISRVGVSRDLLPPESEETTTVTVTPRDASQRPLGAGRVVSIELSAGEPLGGVVDRGGRYERVFVAHAPRGAVGIVSVLVDGIALTTQPRVYFVPSRAEAGGDLRPGGGCAVGRGAPATAVSWALVLVVAVGLLRRRRS
jgi:subtilisin family serine protease